MTLSVRASFPVLSIGRWWRMEGALHLLALPIPVPSCGLLLVVRSVESAAGVLTLFSALRPCVVFPLISGVFTAVRSFALLVSVM